MSEPNEPSGPPAEPVAPAGLPDVGGLLDGLQKIQEAQAEVFEGQSGGGAVRVTASGAMVFDSVTIAPEAVDPDDVEMLQDLVLAALHDLTDRIAGAQRQAMGNLGGMKDLLGGLLGGDPPAPPG